MIAYKMQLNWLTFKVTIRNCRIGVKIQADTLNAKQSKYIVRDETWKYVCMYVYLVFRFEMTNRKITGVVI